MMQNERRAILSLAMIMSFRMLGMFMILPIFALYAKSLPGATPTLIGFALGIYGLSQACLQIPLGSLSDRIGRKPVITAGLCLFAAGSIIAALSHSIYGIILGRALQGAGAVGSTILAMAADLTRDENRSKAMAVIGLAIGFSFAIALVLGPLLNHWFHLAGIFWATLVFATLSIVMLHTLAPTPPTLAPDPTTEFQNKRFSEVFKNLALQRLNLGIFSMHAMLTATFIAVPILLAHKVHLSQFNQVILYLTVLVLAFIIMVPFIIIAEKRRLLKPIFLSSIGVLIIAEILLANFQSSLLIIGVTLLLFFTAFTLLEASTPSLVSKIAPIKRKGTAMGIYSTSQFLGIFVGGSLGGIIFAHFNITGVFLFCAALGALWLTFAYSMPQPPYFSTLILSLSTEAQKQFETLQKKLLNFPGVHEIATIANEDLIYIKADKKLIDKDQLRKLIDEGTLHQSESLNTN